MSEFMKGWGDKFILVFLILFFTAVALLGYMHHEADQASFASDLSKQLVSAILTLLVASRVPWNKPTDSTTVSTTVESTQTKDGGK